MKRRRARAAEEAPFLGPGDLEKAGLVLMGSILALVPRRAWSRIARLAGRAVARMPGGRAGRRAAEVPAPLVELIGGGPREALARYQAAHLLEVAQVMRLRLSRDPPFEVEFEGRDRLDAALAAGHGAVLWVSNFTSSNIVAKVGLSQAGYRAGHISRPGHPFGDSRFARRLLNSLQCRVEARYLSEGRLVLEGEGVAGLRAARGLLARNACVSVTVGDDALRRVQAPFLGGSIHLATGPMHLAEFGRVAALAGVGPACRDGRYRLVVEEALPAAKGQHYLEAATAYAEGLERRVREYPAAWYGWQGLVTLG